MKKLLAAVTMMVSFCASAGQFQEGVHYKVLGSEAFSAPNQVVKIYSVNCPFCYKYDKAVIPDMVRHLPEGASFDAYELPTKPPFGLEKASMVAVAKTLGKKQYHDVQMAYYKRYHDEHKKFEKSEDVTKYGLQVLGISKQEYDQKLASTEVQDLLKKWEDIGVPVAKIQGIPAIVVNGKYLINTKSVRSQQMLNEMVADLLTK